MISASTIISIAAGQIGTTEKPINKVKYNTWFYGKEVSGSAYPWCMAFVMWVFSKAGASNLIYGGRKSAYCPTVMSWFKANGRLYKDPQPGDVVFYNFSGGHTAVHTGIVERVGIGTITAIEGNTSAGSSGSQTNGGMVARRIRNRSCCLGFGRPAYTVAAAKTSETKVEPAQSFSHSYNRRYAVTASSLNLRAGAGEDHSIIAQMPKGTSVQCFGYYTKKLGTIWLLVKYGTQTGYCSARYLG